MEDLAASLLEEAPLDYDSDTAADEIESAPQHTSRQLGLRTVAELFKNAIVNRTNSKKALKEHRPQARAPNTQNNHTRWLNIFKAFLRTLQVPDGTVPTGDHIYRFVHTVSHTLKSRYIDKERPSVITIKGGIAVLDKVLKEIYPDFEITKSKCLQIDSLLNKLVQDKVLTAGRWRPSGRVGFRTLLVLADTWVNTGLADGVRSWDTYISRLLGIVLISSLSARSGDVLRTQIYEGMECCLFRDLAVSFQGGDDTEHLIMNVCLRFVKGYKQLPNIDRHVRVDILSSVAHNSICPIKLLIIHALRTGAVNGTTWKQLRANTIVRADKTIQWATPENPVIPAMNIGRSSFLQLDKPASTAQALATLHAMSIKAKCTERLRVHDLRYGSARDLAHIRQSRIRGYASMTVASALGHKMSTFMNDVSEQYVGGSDVSMWNLRVESDWVDSRMPKMGSSAFVPTRLGEGELESYCRSMGWDPMKASNIQKARVHIRRSQEERWRASLKVEPVQASSPATKPVLQSLGAGSSRGINAKVTPRQRVATDFIDVPIDPQILAESSSTNLVHSTHLTNDEDDEDTQNPDLVELNAEEHDNAMHLLGIVTTQTGTFDSAQNENADIDLLDTLDNALQSFDESDPVHSPAEGFIEYFSRINIIRNQEAGAMGETTFEKEAHRFVPIGNSRDIPTRFIYRCSNRNWGCQYICYYRSRIEDHIRKCKISESNPDKSATFKCRKPGCDREFKTLGGRKSHEQAHNFERRQCDICEDDKWYSSMRQWNHHISVHHNDEWDSSTTCGVPNCPRGETPFSTRQSYQEHLRVTHKLQGPDIARYLPVSATRASQLGKRKCPFDDCDRELADRSKMVRHLKSKVHSLSDTEVAAKIEEIMKG